MNVVKSISAEQGGLTQDNIYDILSLLPELPVNGRIPFLDILSLDNRPKLLFRREAIGYLTYIQQVINYSHVPLRGVYVRFANDFITPSLLDITDLYLVDTYKLNYDVLSKLLEPERYNNEFGNELVKTVIKEYCKNKFSFGTLNEQQLKTLPELTFLFEMVTMGVDLATVKLERATEFNGFRMHYKRRFLNLELRNYRLTFVQTDIANPHKYPLGFSKILDDGIDLYMQKCSSELPDKYSTFMPRISASIRPHGFLLTNDINTDGKRVKIVNYIEGFSDMMTTKTIEYFREMLKTPFHDWRAFEQGRPIPRNQRLVMEYALFMDIREKKTK